MPVLDPACVLLDSKLVIDQMKSKSGLADGTSPSPNPSQSIMERPAPNQQIAPPLRTLNGHRTRASHSKSACQYRSSPPQKFCLYWLAGRWLRCTRSYCTVATEWNGRLVPLPVWTLATRLLQGVECNSVLTNVVSNELPSPGARSPGEWPR